MRYFQNIISAAYATSSVSIKDTTGSSTSIAIIDNQTKTNTTYFIFPSQKAIFGPAVNVIKQGDAAILNELYSSPVQFQTNCYYL